MIDAAQFTLARLAQLAQSTQSGRLIVITSTCGDGEPPDNIAAFYRQLHAPDAPALTGLSYCVLALGDKSYPNFAKCGRDIDTRLAALGATRLADVSLCDAGAGDGGQGWLRMLTALLAGPANTPAASVTTPAPAAQPAHAYKPQLFPAELVFNRKLNGPGAGREIRQVVFSLRGSGLTYEPGDALGITPRNSAELVDDVLRASGCCGLTPVALPDGARAPLADALTYHYDISALTPALVAAFAQRCADPGLLRLTQPEHASRLKDFMHGHQLIDLLDAHPATFDSAADLASVLVKLRPRLYSIASSLKQTLDEVHLTIGVLQYASAGRTRLGVSSGGLAQMPAGGKREIFVHPNRGFRLPVDAARPVIMIGPGTGIAPFRAFLQERAATGAPGKNWLFFGCTHPGHDFIYKDELEVWRAAGILSRLDVAFSRAQHEKIYVQHLMRKQAGDLWRWLNCGAHLYVCGDAARMAKDVDNTLLEIAAQAGGLTPEGAAGWVDELRQERRYLRDVY